MKHVQIRLEDEDYKKLGKIADLRGIERRGMVQQFGTEAMRGFIAANDSVSRPPNSPSTSTNGQVNKLAGDSEETANTLGSKKPGTKTKQPDEEPEWAFYIGALKEILGSGNAACSAAIQQNLQTFLAFVRAGVKNENPFAVIKAVTEEANAYAERVERTAKATAARHRAARQRNSKAGKHTETDQEVAG